MILAQGARGPGFNSRSSPISFSQERLVGGGFSNAIHQWPRLTMEINLLNTLAFIVWLHGNPPHLSPCRRQNPAPGFYHMHRHSFTVALARTIKK